MSLYMKLKWLLEIVFVQTAVFYRFVLEAFRFISLSAYIKELAKEASGCWVNYNSRTRKVKKC